MLSASERSVSQALTLVLPREKRDQSVLERVRPGALYVALTMSAPSSGVQPHPGQYTNLTCRLFPRHV